MTKKKRKKKKSFFDSKAAVVVTAIIVLEIVFIGVYFLTTAIYNKVNEDNTEATQTETDTYNNIITTTVSPVFETEKTTEETTTSAETTTKKQSAPSSYMSAALIIDYPEDDASWKLICLNRYRCVDASVEDKISLSYVAGSSERMDSRAAAAYEKMYDAAALDGIYLTPCSGYRSYSRQKTLYYEFVNDYINDGYSEAEAHNLASKRRNPPGSSEHNIGICMDIICAASSANFQNTEAYAWLTAHAQDYGFILRYPEDKVDITGVKFEPWHWRYVGVENASAIKNSGLCLEEYLGLA